MDRIQKVAKAVSIYRMKRLPVIVSFIYLCIINPTLVDAQTTNSHTADYYFQAGATNLDKKEWNLALANYEKALLLTSNKVEAYEGLGAAYFLSGDLEDAITTFTHVVQIAPKNAMAYLNRGNVYRAAGIYDLAISDCNECILLDPANSLAYGCRAAAFFHETNNDNAISDLTKCLKLTPNDVNALVFRGDIYFKTKQYKKALPDYERAIKIDHNRASNDVAWFLATCPDAAMRNGARAVKYATTACQLSGWQDPKPIDTLAAAYAETGDYEKATEYEKKAVALYGIKDHLLQEMQKRISLYAAERPYRDN
jgi:tetratricopeptide (TPR) repeat protein